MATIDKKQYHKYHSLNYKRHELYFTWANMIQRCNNINQPSYYLYGKRGIKVCDEWLKFENFVKDMGEKPKKFTLDRIDNNGNYSKENCRWVCRTTQNNNTRKNRYIKYNGEIKSVSQWATFFNIKSSTFRQRFYVYKFPFEKCIISKLK